MADRYLCRVCLKAPTATKNHRYRTHTHNGDTCPMSSEPIPEDLEPSEGPEEVPEEDRDFTKCPHCTRNVQIDEGGKLWPHQTTLRGSEKCPNSRMKFTPLKPTEDVLLPGDPAPEKSLYQVTHPAVSAQMEVDQERIGVPRFAAETAAYTEPAGPGRPVAAAIASGVVLPTGLYERNLQGQSMEETRRILGSATSAKALPASPPPSTTPGGAASATPSGGTEWPSAPDAPSGVSTETNSPGSSTMSTSSPTPSPGPSPSPTGTVSAGRYLQPPPYVEPSRYLQPSEYAGATKPGPMTGPEAEIATRFKEIFYSHSNRRSTDNRSAQTTLGPSEIGTPCDRRLAMALMGVGPVNPGGDGWAAWLGTQGHTGLEQMFKWASANTGRFSTEVRLKFPSKFVPHGTSDLFDRVYGEVWDFKFMGAYSLKKFKLEGPSQTYQIQGDVYGLGQELAGEKVKRVVILGLPRAGSSLDEMHVWSKPYDKKAALAALSRVDAIAAEVQSKRQYDTENLMEVAREFPAADDCRYCPFHLKNDKEMIRGCPGS